MGDGSIIRKNTGKVLRYKVRTDGSPNSGRTAYSLLDTVMLVAWKDGKPEWRFGLKKEFAIGMHDESAQR